MAEMKFYYQGKYMDRQQMRIARGLEKPKPKRKADLSTETVLASKQLEEREQSEGQMLDALNAEVKIETEVAEQVVEDNAGGEGQEEPIEAEKAEEAVGEPKEEEKPAEAKSGPILKTPEEMTYPELIAALKTADKMPDKNPKKEEAIAILKGE